MNRAMLTLVFSFLLVAANAQGQNLINPDLDNAGGEQVDDAPNSWVKTNGTPDVVDGAANFLCTLSTIDVCGVYAPGTSNTLFARMRNSNNNATCGNLAGEGIAQTLGGLSVGAPYQVCFKAINAGVGDNCEDESPEAVDLQVAISGQATQGVTIPYQGSATWNEYCVNYSATSSSHTFGVQMPEGNAGLGKGHVFFDVVENIVATDTDGDGNPDVNDPNPTVATAANDFGSATALIATTIDIIGNDDYLINNDPANLGTIAITRLAGAAGGTANGTVGFNAATGELTYTPNLAEAAGMPTVIYEVCNSETSVCATATVTITVSNDTDGDGNPDATDDNDTVGTAIDDAAAGTAGVAGTFNILTNDDFLPNNDANNVGTTTITRLAGAAGGTAVGSVAFNATTGELTYTPTLAEAAGTPTVIYQVCNTDPDPDVCATATATITVSDDTDGDGNPDANETATSKDPNTVNAADDAASGTVNVAGTFNILANDDFLPNNDTNNVGTTTITRLGGTAVGTVVFDAATGELTYTPLLTEAAGTPTVIYEVCNTSPDPDVCATATATITVSNDTDGDGNPDATDDNDTIATAVDDAASGTAGVAGTFNILANDDFLPNNDANNVGTTTITRLAGAAGGTAVGSVAFNATTGELTYTPTLAEAAGTPTVIYQVCNTDPDPDVCATATATITVSDDTDGDGNPDANETANATDPSTVNAADDADTGTVGVAGTFNLLTNDDFLPNNDLNNVGTTTITRLAGAAGGTATGTVNLNATTGELTYTPVLAEAAGTPTVIYQVCNTDPDPDVCATATATITVSDDTDGDGNPDANETATSKDPNTANAADDAASGTVNVAGTFSILVNDDFLPNNDANNVGTTTITRLAGVAGGTATGTLILNATTGELTYTPNLAESAGTPTVIYEVCNTDPDPDVCATATATITVSDDTDGDGNPDTNETATSKDPNTANAAGDAAAGTAGVAGTFNILANDDFLPNDDANNVGTTTITRLAGAAGGTAAGTVNLNATTGELTYTPVLAEAAGSPTVVYEVCNSGTSVCATATATITVSDDTDGDGNPDANETATSKDPNAVNAADDADTGTVGVAGTLNLLTNDDFLPNNDANNVGTTTITRLAGAAGGTATGTVNLNATTGELTYTPVLAEAAGTPTVIYEVCNTNPDPDVCATATATITVSDDTDGDGNPDANETANATDPNTVNAADDAASGTVGVAATFSILANDDFLPNNDVNNVGTTTITRLAGAAGGTATGTVNLNATTGELTYTPVLAEAAGTPTVIYEVCNSDTSVCATATVTITVSNDTDGDGNPDANETATSKDPNAVNAADDADTGTVGVAATFNILANDDFLPNNDPNNVGTTTITRLAGAAGGTATGTVNLNATTGELTYTPVLAEAAGSPTVIYEVCNSDTSVCATATATITVSNDTDGDGNPDANETATSKDPNAVNAADDADTGTVGVAGTLNLLTNDDFLPNNDVNNVGTTTITRLAGVAGGTATGTVAFNATTGELTYTPVLAEAAGTPTVIYEVCNTDPDPDVCATATATITVSDDTDGDGNPDANETTNGTDPNTVNAADDADTGTVGVAGTFNILANDDFLPNNDANSVGTTTITRLAGAAGGTAIGTVVLNATTGELTYTPVLAEAAGTPTVIYQVCNTDPDPDVCATATATITVSDDTDGDGNPDANETATSKDPNTVNAADDADTGTVGVAGTFNILVNDDFLPNNDANNVGTTTITRLAGAAGGTAVGTVVLNATTGELTYTPVLAEAAGTPTVIYQVCNTDPDPDVCATATATITVSDDTDGDGNPDANETANATDPNTVNAADDAASGTVGVAGTFNLLTNDDFLPNNDANNVGTTTITRLAGAAGGTAVGTVTLNATTGQLTYTPTLAEVGNAVTVIYEVCNTDPDPDVCATATATITVSGDTDGDGNPDANETTNGTDPNTVNAADDADVGTVGVAGTFNLLANDDFLPNNDVGNIGTTTLAQTGGTAAGTVSLDPLTGTLTYTPTLAEANNAVTVVYEVCNSDTSVCATATATITVSNDTDGDGNPDANETATSKDPNTVNAADDADTGTVDVAGTFNILTNDDFLPNNDANNVGTTTITRLAGAAGGTAVGEFVFNATIGGLAYTPTFAEAGGMPTVIYEVCNTAPDPDVCATATATITVSNDTDNDGIPDAVEGNIDSDGDGLLDFNDQDADNDGIPDAVEAGPTPAVPVDSDADGTPDYLDIDSDGDRITDRVEAGATPMVPVDTDGDTIPDYIDTDSDNDNIADVLEDSNSPVPSGDDVDLDGIDDAVDVSVTGGNDDGLNGGIAGNGIDDAYEPTDTDADGKPNHLDLDSDGDGILDILESVVVPAPIGNDDDGDGIDDAIDVDATMGDDLNNNGIDDAREPVDTDSDGKPDYLDLDADNDSIPDVVEAAPNGGALPTLSGNDSDSDGIDDAVDPDSGGSPTDTNGNGVSDNGEPVNTDNALDPLFGDSVPDYLDLDSDNDSLLDIEEAGNGGAVPEVNDINMDGLVDGPSDEGSVSAPADTDSEAEPNPGNRDLIPDYRDLESTNSANDGSGPFDISTNPNPPADNGAGMVSDSTDSDGDGIADSTDPQPNGFGGGLDSDLDGLPNDMDLDDDNDGIPDLVEGFNASDPAASTDTDGDGTPDYLDLDSDNDGLTDLIESSPTAVDTDNNGRIDTFVDVNIDGLDDIVAVQTPVDTDADGTPDYRDLDSDNDGLTDLAESLAPGIAASGIDADGDGVQDAINPVTGRPLNPLTPQDNDIDGLFDFRVAAGITLNNLPGGPGVGLRTSVSGGGGSMGVFGIGLLGLAALRKRLPKRATHLAASGLLLLLVGLAPAPQLNAETIVQERERTLCGFYSNSGNQRLSSKVGRDRDGADFGNCWYGGLGVAYSHLHPEGTDGNGWATDNSEDRDIGWEIIIGKRLSEKWFAELKYVDQGEAGLESSNAVLNDAYPDANITYRTTSLMLGRYFRGSDKRFNLYAKAGMASINNDDHDNGDPATVQFNEVTSEQLAFGAGVEYRFKNRARWFVRLNADFYDQDSSMASLSLNRFIGGKTTRRAVGPAVVTAVAATPAPASPPALVPEPYVQPAPGPSAAQRAADCGKFDSVVEGVNFETDSARLTSDSRYRLLSYARALASYPQTVIMVSAHTDWIGSGEYNQSLSDRRAASVVEYLIKSGVSPGQLLSRGYGESRPIASNNTAEGRSRNRRVELSIVESPGCGR